jgi:hypothetical protein
MTTKELIVNSKAYGTHTILYDEEDEELVMSYTWHIAKRGSGPSCRYVAQATKRSPCGGFSHPPSYGGARKGKRITIQLHRLVMNLSKGWRVKHANGNYLDNRKANLLVKPPGGLLESSNK